ncbi:glycosyl hydrolase family 65 protein [Nocardia sp. NPDC088792]|uniref:glycosyl hydrolase family 65 protein n=1 Tax=Nocardia sp. NPDC088792 TaxID=3364332 RepID=UPI003827BF93
MNGDRIRTGAEPAPDDAQADDDVRASRAQQSVDGDSGIDPRWAVREDPARHRVSDASVFTVGSGGFATRGTPEELDGDTAGVLVAGAYTGTGPEQQLLEGPVWTRVDIDPPPATARWCLNLADGVLSRAETLGERDFHSLRFACADRPGVFAMRVRARDSRLLPGPPLRAPAADPDARVSDAPMASFGPGVETRCLRVVSAIGTVTAAAAQRFVDGRLDRVAVYTVGSAGQAMRELRRAWTRGVDGLLAEQRATWARRWDDAGIDLPDDPATELAVRFALFQLWCNAGGHGESAVGARGVSGSGYRGHVFWDSDVFVLPAMVSLDPAAAAAMVTYRRKRLSAAHTRAAADGRAGARFPWESAADGTDVTPRSGFLGGTAVPILTGTMEEHITADIAWAADHYAEWTGAGAARELLTDTARYWASRVRVDTTGHGHIEGVIGPDEYHESVDDNAFTNVMARWNLRRAARLTPETASEETEFAAWRDLAERIVDQLRPDGRYEQFTGYFDLESLTADSVAPPPMAADVLLGQARVAGSQLIKQPDVLMLHHMIPEEVAPGSLAVNLDFYGPRTTHGSSLSQAPIAALLARAGRAEEALDMLEPALRLDLDDRTATSAGGLHMATLGGAWQAMLFGFGGIRVRGGVLSVRPLLPRRWRRLSLRFHCLGRKIRLDLTTGGVAMHTDGPIPVSVGTHATVVVSGESWWPTMGKE